MMSDDRRQKIHPHCANEQNQFKHQRPLARRWYAAGELLVPGIGFSRAVNSALG